LYVVLDVTSNNFKYEDAKIKLEAVDGKFVVVIYERA